METTRRTTRKFLTTLVGQICNRRLVTRVLERKKSKWRLGAVPKAYVCNWTESVRVNLDQVFDLFHMNQLIIIYRDTGAPE